MVHASGGPIDGTVSNSTGNSYQRAHFDWLRLRYRLDVTARHRQLETQVLRYLGQRRTHKLRVLDLGAGAGANFYYYSQRLPSTAEWWLVERDTELLTHLPRFISGTSKEVTPARLPKNICLLPHDFLATDCPIYDRPFDLVLANAVFDLVSAEQFRWLLIRFRQAWESVSPLFLFTLNLDRGLRCYPADHASQFWCRRYEEHMQRRQSFGWAMGADCASQMKELLKEQGFKVRSGPSPWRISPGHSQVLHAKLDFVAHAMPDLICPGTPRWEAFQRWLAHKRRQIRQQNLALFVPHRDFFAKLG